MKALLRFRNSSLQGNCSSEELLKPYLFKFVVIRPTQFLNQFFPLTPIGAASYTATRL